MKILLVHSLAAWTLAAAVVAAAFGRPFLGEDLSPLHLHFLAAFVCGCSAAAGIAWSRPYLYGLFVVIALIIPVAGPGLVLVLSHLAKRESLEGMETIGDPFVCGLPLRESTRGASNEQKVSFTSGYRSMDHGQLEATLGDLVKGNDAPLMSLNRCFRNHSNIRVKMIGQACVADRLKQMERQVREFERRLVFDARNPNALLSLCELHLAVLDQRLVMPNESVIRAQAGMDAVRQLLMLGDDCGFDAAIVFYETQFALHLGEEKLATAAWERLVKIMEQRRMVSPGDRFHLLGAEINLARGNLAEVREHVRKLEPDTPSKFWLQEFWLEPVPEEAL